MEPLLRRSQNILCVCSAGDAAQYATINALPDGRITHVNMKGADAFDYMYIGVAIVYDYDEFWETLGRLVLTHPTDTSLSDVHVYRVMLQNKFPLHSHYVQNYHDIGNITSYKKANDYIRPRFNVLGKTYENLTFHDDHVIKFFHNASKCCKILQRAEHIGMGNIPKIYRHSENFICMEYIDSKPVAEIYSYGNVSRILRWAHSNLWTPVTIDQDLFRVACHRFYYCKTMDRVAQYLSTNAVDFTTINGIHTGTIHNLLDMVDFDMLCVAEPTRYHGDFIMDNILLRPDHVFVLIDWREDFGGLIEAGDMYYDLAKFRHNIYFNHSNILQGLYSVTQNGSGCTVDMKSNFFLIQQIESFDKFVTEQQLSMRKIKIIQALIWINMAPLYNGSLSTLLFNLGKYMLALAMDVT